MTTDAEKRFEREERFHDAWADSTSVKTIDIHAVNEACTAPEMRFITKELGDISGKTLLDVGCGLGEASVYFATKGARVTATDISQLMLEKTAELARHYKTEVQTHKSTAEDLCLGVNKKFDIIYVGNLLHHVDINETLGRLQAHVKPSGKLVSWDPVAYNPVINVYRRIATNVRTPDEHPLRLKDLNLFKNHFQKVRRQWFWLFTLSVFLLMFLFQKRDPNKERFWKVVLYEGEKWKKIYRPLEFIDRILLKLFPFLKPLCWNVVVIAEGPRQKG